MHLLLRSQRSLETRVIFRFVPKLYFFRDGRVIFHDGRKHDEGILFFGTTTRSK